VSDFFAILSTYPLDTSTESEAMAANPIANAAPVTITPGYGN